MLCVHVYYGFKGFSSVMSLPVELQEIFDIFKCQKFVEDVGVSVQCMHYALLIIFIAYMSGAVSFHSKKILINANFEVE